MKNVLVFSMVMLASLEAAAQTAASVCGSILMSDDKSRCLQSVAGHQLEPGAAAVCAAVLMSSDKIACLTAALDKHYERDELAACRSILMGGDKATCMASAGTRPQVQAPEPRERDDDHRRRSRRDRDDDEEEDDTRTLRVTNYHAGSVSQVFWRRSSERRFHEARLSANIGTNQYNDVTVGDGKIELCVQTPDGFRLWWQKVKRQEDVVIAADEPNWSQGRCRELR